MNKFSVLTLVILALVVIGQARTAHLDLGVETPANLDSQEFKAVDAYVKKVQSSVAGAKIVSAMFQQ